MSAVLAARRAKGEKKQREIMPAESDKELLSGESSCSKSSDLPFPKQNSKGKLKVSDIYSSSESEEYSAGEKALLEEV